MQNSPIKILSHAYQSGSLIIYNAMTVNIPPSKTLNYQTMSSAFMFPISGEAKIKLANKSIVAKPGKLIYIPFATHLDITILSESIS